MERGGDQDVSCLNLLLEDTIWSFLVLGDLIRQGCWCVSEEECILTYNKFMALLFQPTLHSEL